MGGTAPQGPPRAGAKSDGERVSAFAHLLLQAVETGRTRPPHDLERMKLESDLEAKLHACLHEIGEIRIQLDDLDLVYAGETVYRSPAREGSVPSVLFHDGVREILLRRGLPTGQLMALVRAMRVATDPRHRGWDDAVTLLWEQGFTHVRYTCASEAAPEPDGGADMRAAGGDPAAAAEPPRIPWPGTMDTEPDEESPSGAPEQERCDDWSFPAPAGEAPREAPGPPPPPQEIELENLRMTLAIEMAIPAQDQALAILSGLLDAETDPAALFETASVVCEFIEQAVLEGDFARANQLADRLVGASGAARGTGGERDAAARQALEQIGREDFLARLAPVLNARPDADLAELSKLLARLGSAAAPGLCDLLYEVQVRRTRRAICEAMVISCKRDVSVLIRKLSDSRWYVVRNVLYVLGRIAHQGVERALGEALDHEDIRVRREAIVALAEVDSPSGRAYLNSALRDPEKEIRVLVAGLISRRRNDRAAQVLWSVIEAPEFATRDPEERKAFFAAVGRTGSDVLIPRLERDLTRGAWSRSDGSIHRTEAALARAGRGTPAALAVLRREAGSRREEVRQAVGLALQNLRDSSPGEKRADWGR
jgi:HEAT repeat protein